MNQYRDVLTCADRELVVRARCEAAAGAAQMARTMTAWKLRGGSAAAAATAVEATAVEAAGAPTDAR